MSQSDPSSQPLATYTEKLPQVKRTFRLFKDRVEIDAKWTVGKDYQTTIQLADLTTQTKTTTIRNRWFKKSIMIGSLALAVAATVPTRDFPQFVKNTALLGWPLAMGCFFICIRTFSKRRFTNFIGKDGQVAMDICSAGPDRARYNTFVREVEKRIRKA